MISVMKVSASSPLSISPVSSTIRTVSPAPANLKPATAPTAVTISFRFDGLLETERVVE